MSPNMDMFENKRDIHVFCNAPENVYGSVAFLVTDRPNGSIEVAFLTARSRVTQKGSGQFFC